MADHSPAQLPSAVEQLIAEICAKQKLPPLGAPARTELSLLGEEESLRILRTIASSQIKSSFDGFVNYLARKRNSPDNEKRLCDSPPSPLKPVTPSRPMMYHQYDADFSSPVGKQPDRAAVNWPDISPELEALSGLEFRKQFLVLSYLGGQKLEGFLSADYIRRLSEMPMEKFEAEVWNSVGQKCDYIKNFDRIRYVCWDSGKTHIYQCHVYPEGYYRFKGPHLAPTNNLLQRTLGDENVLLVKIAEDTDKRSSKCKVNDCFSKYGWLARKGILVGLRRYRFFVFKDGGKEEKKKDPTTSQVKCYFVRMESHEPTGDSEYILQGKTVREARSVFMNVDSLSILSKYMARFSLILSKTIGLDVDLSCVNIERIDDVVCLDNGNAVKDKDGKDRIHTDGTGFISEDLALKCQNDYLKGKWLNATTVEIS